MTRFHQWKGRMQNQTEGFPFVNGPPFLDGTGNPVFPDEAGVGGYSVTGFPGPTVVFTFTGEATGDHTVIWQLGFKNAALQQLFAEGTFPVTAGEDNVDVATAFETDLKDKIAETDIVVTRAANVVTLTCVDQNDQTINAYYFGYAN